MKSSRKLANKMKLRNLVETKRYCATQSLGRDPPLELDSQLTKAILADQSAIVQSNFKRKTRINI